MPDDDLKERVRAAIDIVSVIGERVALKKAGRNFLGLCPFHNEKTPSFNVNPERQIYHCFGCGAGGDVFGFLIAHDKVSFPEALRSLADKAGIPLTDRQSIRSRTNDQARDIYYRANALAKEYFSASFRDEAQGKAARTYLAQRGITDETIAEFGLGYAPDAWDGFLAYVRSKGISPEVLANAGLVVQNEQGRFYDRFRGRVTFSIANDGGRVVAFGARTLDPDGEPKYLNSSESPVYQKGRLLYGLYNARDAIRQQDQVLIVEGYMDVLQLVQAGIKNVVATCGTALTRDHGVLLRRYAQKIVLLFDGDEAGIRAAERAGDVLLEAGIEAVVALLPGGEDPDTLVAAEGPEALHSIAAQGVQYLQFRWSQSAKRNNLATISGRNRAISDTLDVVARVEDEMLRELMGAQVAQWGVTDEALVLRAIARRRKQTPRRARETAPPAPKRWSPPDREKQLIAWMIDHPGICQQVAEMGMDRFTDPLLEEVASALIRLNDMGKLPSVAGLIDEKPDDPDWAAAVAEIGQMWCEVKEITKAVSQLIASLEVPYVRRQIVSLRARMRTERSDSDTMKITGDIQRLGKRLEELHGVLHDGDG
jgi:DNA primase